MEVEIIEKQEAASLQPMTVSNAASCLFVLFLCVRIPKQLANSKSPLCNVSEFCLMIFISQECFQESL